MFVCVLLTQGAPLKKVLKFVEEGICQQSSIYIHPLQRFYHKRILHPIERDTLENSCVLVANVGSVFRLTSAYTPI